MAGDVIHLVNYITGENSRMLIIVNAHRIFRWSAVFPLAGKKLGFEETFYWEIWVFRIFDLHKKYKHCRTIFEDKTCREMKNHIIFISTKSWLSICYSHSLLGKSTKDQRTMSPILILSLLRLCHFFFIKATNNVIIIIKSEKFNKYEFWKCS